MDVGSKGVHNGQISAVSSNGAEKSETHIDTLEPASTGAPFPVKKVLLYTDDVVNDSSPITLSNEGLSGTTEVETTKPSSERVDRGTTLSSSKGECETELRNSFFPFKFQWLQYDICQCWLHQRSLEARSST